MTQETMKHYEEMLQSEKTRLEEDLSQVGRKNPDNPQDWEATQIEVESIKSDENDTAYSIDEYENNAAILKQLETRHKEVLLALQKMQEGTFGICEISGETIEEDRLEANPAARTSKSHLGEEGPFTL